MAWTRFGKKKDMPGGLWIKCERCGTMLFRKDFEARNRVCSSCDHHFTLPARDRLALTADPDSFAELYPSMTGTDRLGFNDRVPYAEKLRKTEEKTGECEAMLIGTCTIKGIPAVIGVMNFAFLGGSMGAVVGEKVALAAEHALANGLPLILFSCSGGARMHEGPISLMQMAKTCTALARLHDAGGFSVSVMTHPTTGGVTASFASVCDVLMTEPGALIGFAGPRVIATTIKKELPKGFQRAEFLLDKGQIDLIVTREKMRDELARLLAYATGADPVMAYASRADAEDQADAETNGGNGNGNGKARADADSEAKPAKRSRSRTKAKKSAK
ncbi:MAG: acetyl-CoA carboxylase, carboxyltransferase subunit beta [Planctomycetota bacterium]